jgi:hypothetical protein
MISHHQCSKWKFRSVSKKQNKDISSEKWKIYMDIVYIHKCWYEIKKEKEVPVWHTGIYWPISSTGHHTIHAA